MIQRQYVVTYTTDREPDTVPTREAIRIVAGTTPIARVTVSDVLYYSGHGIMDTSPSPLCRRTLSEDEY